MDDCRKCIVYSKCPVGCAIGSKECIALQKKGCEELPNYNLFQAIFEKWVKEQEEKLIRGGE
jgi:hypothetical protein